MMALQNFIKNKYGKSENLSSNKKIFRGKAPTLYVVRLRGQDPRFRDAQYNKIDEHDCVFGNSMPCKDCQKNLIKFNVRVVKYTNIIDDIPVLCELKLTL